MDAYRGRLAPSPTGYLHLGHARTFWQAYRRARAAQGTLVLRMEDLDPDRSRAEYAAAAIEDLAWLGIRWQEGPGRNAGPEPPASGEGAEPAEGPFAPYEQSRRRAVYLEAWRRLRERGAIYACRCSRRELALAAGAPHEAAAADPEPLYPGTCRELGLAEGADTPAGFHWRFRVPDGAEVAFEDRNLGPQRFVAGQDFGDFPVWRRDDVPAYQLAAVADDRAMGITEVVRGLDLLRSTARQILLARALGHGSPAWFHCRLVTDAGGRRLAKRSEAESLRSLRQRGVPPEEVREGGATA